MLYIEVFATICYHEWSLLMTVTCSMPPADGVLHFLKEGTTKRAEPVPTTGDQAQSKWGCCIITGLIGCKILLSHLRALMMMKLRNWPLNVSHQVYFLVDQSCLVLVHLQHIYKFFSKIFKWLNNPIICLSYCLLI